MLLQIKITASWRTAPSQQGRNNTPVSGTDFYTTLLELAGIRLKPQEHTDGQSLVPLLKEKKTAQRPLIWHYPHYGNQGGEPSSIIRLGDWKLIHYYEDGREELYNLKNDISETIDLAAKNQAKVIELSKKLFSCLNEVGAKFPVKDLEYDQDLKITQSFFEKISSFPRNSTHFL